MPQQPSDKHCENLIQNVDWVAPESIVLLVVLLTVAVVVIVGNSLVIAAVYISPKLRNVTNLFIVSLALADLLVGLTVLPFSATWEVYQVWIFGDIWCSVWLAVDVWMCTASILNLCAISLDRYLAVSKPVSYPSLMTPKRAKILIVCVWCLSFGICFPPLVKYGQNYTTFEPVTMTGSTPKSSVRIHGKHTVITEDATTFSYQTNFSEHFIEFKTEFKENRTLEGSKSENSSVVAPTVESTVDSMLKLFRCPWICELTNDKGYVIYSALGSFFIPMFIMLNFYWRIYLAAVRTTRAINQGFRTTKGISPFGNRFDDQRLTLRIHRGRGSVQNHSSVCSSSVNLDTNGHYSLSASPSTTSTGRSPECHRLTRGSSKSKHEQVKISVSYPSSDHIISLPTTPRETKHLTPASRRASLSTQRRTTLSPSPTRKTFEYNDTKENYEVHYKNGKDVRRESSCYLKVVNTRPSGGRCSIDSTTSNYETTISRRNSAKSSEDGKPLTPSPTFDEQTAEKPRGVTKMGKRNIKAQVKRIRMETKAAKTVGIIVGLFILCWFPFFSSYLIRVFCENCIHPKLFAVLFWLGYINSAVNPFIYALFSKDFRFAFKKILCQFLCGRKNFYGMPSWRRGSDGSQLKTPISERRKSPKVNRHPSSLNEESDHAGIESR